MLIACKNNVLYAHWLRSWKCWMLIGCEKVVLCAYCRLGQQYSMIIVFDMTFPMLIGRLSSQYFTHVSAVDVVVDLSKGRKLVAKETIPAGSLIIRDEPIGWEILSDYADQVCHNCCIPLGNFWLPCGQCARTGIRFESFYRFGETTTYFCRTFFINLRIFLYV